MLVGTILVGGSDVNTTVISFFVAMPTRIPTFPYRKKQPSHTIMYYTIMHHNVYTVMYHTIVCYSVLCYSILYYTILYYAILRQQSNQATLASAKSSSA